MSLIQNLLLRLLSAVNRRCLVPVVLSVAVIGLCGGGGNNVDAQQAEENWRLPFQAGYQLTLDQAYFGTFSHSAPGSQYALDIQGDKIPISAARSGVVSAIRNGGKWNQWCNRNADCIKKGGIFRGNHVEITHSDGSISLYLHMLGGSVPSNLSVGSPVRQGQNIGLMSDTGYTCSLLFPNCSVSDPHIHFEVRKNGVSIPINFEDCNYHQNQCVDGTPISYRYYTSINTDPFTLYQIPGSIQRLKSSPYSMKVAQNTRGSYILTSPADKGDSFQRIGSSLRGPQNWCIDTESGIFPPYNGLKITTNDCKITHSQAWTQSLEGVLYLSDTTYCIAPTNGHSFESLDQSLVVTDCSSQKFSWGNLGDYGLLQNNCLTTFGLSSNYCRNFGTIPRPALLHTFEPAITVEQADVTLLLDNESPDQNFQTYKKSQTDENNFSLTSILNQNASFQNLNTTTGQINNIANDNVLDQLGEQKHVTPLSQNIYSSLIVSNLHTINAQHQKKAVFLVK